MDPILISTIIVGLVKIASQLAQSSGLTEEEVNEMFNKEWAKLKENDPNELPDP